MRNDEDADSDLTSLIAIYGLALCIAGAAATAMLGAWGDLVIFLGGAITICIIWFCPPSETRSK